MIYLSSCFSKQTWISLADFRIFAARNFFTSLTVSSSDSCNLIINNNNKNSSIEKVKNQNAVVLNIKLDIF